MSYWNYKSFGETTERLASIEEVRDFVDSLSETTPLRHVWFRFWHHWTEGSDFSLEFANYPRAATSELAAMRETRRRLIDRCCFQRVLPINFVDEIDKSTELGQLILPSLQDGVLPTGFAIAVRGPNGRHGLFVGDCKRERNQWTDEFEHAQGLIQLMGQSLFVAVDRVAGLAPQILTPRERECLSLVAQGKTVKAIAREIGLSDQTVTFYLSRIRMKLGVSNTTQAVAKASKTGML